MEPVAGLEARSTAALDTQRNAPMFTNTSGLDFHGSQFTNILGDMNATYSREEPPPVGPRPILPPSTQDCFYSDSASYCNQLLRRGRGFPLYIPAPRGNLPPEYGARGVSIGDVGRVTPEGVFDFFFNIYLPADHPINANDVPAFFCSVAAYVSTSAVHKLDLGLSEGYVVVHSIGACLIVPGAVLALPLGSRIERLDTFGDMLQYTRQNAENWYKYVNGARGRQLSNGSLYLITGWEKARAWGIAAFQEIPSTRYPFRISFGPTLVNSSFGSQKSYRWTRSCATRTKSSGPVSMDETPLNQTVFIHGFSISLGTSIWARLFGTVEVVPIVDAQLGRSSNDYIPFGAQGYSNTWSFGSFWGSGGAGGRDYGVTLSDIAPTQALFHPSQVMNAYLLHMFPDAAVVMTHDDDWRDILRSGHIPSDASDWDALQLLQRACRGMNAGSFNLVAFTASANALPFVPSSATRSLKPEFPLSGFRAPQATAGLSFPRNRQMLGARILQSYEEEEAEVNEEEEEDMELVLSTQSGSTLQGSQISRDTHGRPSNSHSSVGDTHSQRRNTGPNPARFTISFPLRQTKPQHVMAGPAKRTASLSSISRNPDLPMVRSRRRISAQARQLPTLPPPLSALPMPPNAAATPIDEQASFTPGQASGSDPSVDDPQRPTGHSPAHFAFPPPRSRHRANSLFGPVGAGINNEPWMAPNAAPQQDWRDGLAMASRAVEAPSGIIDDGVHDPDLAPNPFLAPGDNLSLINDASSLLPASLSDSSLVPAVPRSVKDKDQPFPGGRVELND
ncbi:hypothetical protein FB45DRAFT_1024282 [Roridomyces roridus]|uniref:Uncharacterized protein n=1 Tax=Roridomyces roridus TaxID=1738132 RepID=A0AAD7FS71_9AGAR|nr:hypothetical protein FB45DRAFT_1024282 [Roridomyces roridus]